jgi:hypothetical protein
MANEKEMDSTCCSHKKRGMGAHGSSGALYGLGMIGAIVFYLQHATTFWDGILGFFKGVFWPAMLVHKVFELLGM